MSIVGVDADGKEITPEVLWEKTKDQDGQHDTWYKKAVSYWDQQEASYDGVLGGFGHVSDIDIRDSKQVLLKAWKTQFEEAKQAGKKLVAIGVGRITEQLLLHHFQEVDLLEPSQHLINTAEQNLKRSAFSSTFPRGHAMGRKLCMGLEKFDPEPGRYSCIWTQWCLLYLTDTDFLAFFKRCTKGLAPGGLFFVKENICQQGFVVDDEDSSLTRCNAYMLDLFEKADMQVLYNIKQKNFPKQLFEVRMYVLRPRSQGQQQEQQQMEQQ